MRLTNVLRVAVLTWLLYSTTMASAQGAGGEKLGTVTFPVSCTPAASQQFARAVALLHSFWYEERSEEHTSELQSQSNLVCRLLLEKKKKKIYKIDTHHIQQS